MAKWNYTKIGDVCTVERGGSPRPIDKFITDAPDGINWIKIGDTTDSMYITETAQKIIPEGMKKSRYVQPGDFLLSNSMSFGRPYILKIDGCIHDGWLVLRDNSGVFNKHFLYYYLSSPSTYQKFKNMAVGGVVNNLNSDMIRGVTVPVPPMKEQTEIVQILDKISNLISLRKQQLTELDNLVKARFIELFGGEKFAKKPIRELVDRKIASARKTYGSDETIHYIDISSIDNQGNVVTGTAEYIMADAPSRAQQCIKHGDILISTVRPNLRNIARNTYKGDGYVASSGFCVLRAKNCDARFLLCAVLTDSFTNAMTEVTTGANYPAIKDSDVLEYLIPVPPMELQEQFASFVEQTDKSKSAIQQSLDKLETLKKALMQKYFG